jgi:putative NADH-flavin reductase
MSKIIIFGARGKLGRLAALEAEARGHDVTAAQADATDARSVATAAAGHDAAIASLYQQARPHDVFYAAAATALLHGLAEAGVGRLVFVGLATNLETEPGVRIMDGPDFAPEHLPFALGHTAALDVLRAAGSGPVDWAMLTPAMAFDHDGARSGRPRLGGDAVLSAGGGPSTLSYADMAVALVDEATAPTVHRARAAVAT